MPNSISMSALVAGNVIDLKSIIVDSKNPENIANAQYGVELHETQGDSPFSLMVTLPDDAGSGVRISRPGSVRRTPPSRPPRQGFAR